MIAWPPKDPDDVLDYSIDFSAILEADGDTLSAISWTFPIGLTKDSQAEASGVALVWISGGTDGVRYQIGCRATTTGGRTYDRTAELTVREA